MTIESTLLAWIGPSSLTERDKQERTERMIREAISAHAGLSGCPLSIFAKGSYPNNTNVRQDSDVDIAVECTDLYFFDEEVPGCRPTGSGVSYAGAWTPTRLRGELTAALRARFGEQLNASGSTALTVHSSSARVDADVVPCFTYRYYFSDGGHRIGTKVFKTDGTTTINFPQQQLAQGRAKNTRTNGHFKNGVRILKRAANAMESDGVHRSVPSFFVECLAYNCPDHLFLRPTWTETVRGLLQHIWNGLEGPEPTTERWLEVNECKYLFAPGQKWLRTDARDFAAAAWTYLGMG
jgi:hypothetical protein